MAKKHQVIIIKRLAIDVNGQQCRPILET